MRLDCMQTPVMVSYFKNIASLLGISYLNNVLTCTKNIVLFFSVVLYFMFVFSGKLGIVHTTIYFTSAPTIAFVETTTKTESGNTKPQLVPTKPRALVLKIDIQTGTFAQTNQFPSIQKFVFIRSLSPYRLSPQISYVRYLPRDPTKA